MPNPKKNLTWGRNVPTQGNISIQDMFDYLPDNYQDMERPTVPIPNDIKSRYGDMNIEEWMKWKHPEMVAPLQAQTSYPNKWKSGVGTAENAPLKNIPLPSAYSDNPAENKKPVQIPFNQLPVRAYSSLLPLLKLFSGVPLWDVYKDIGKQIRYDFVKPHNNSDFIPFWERKSTRDSYTTES